MSVLAGIGLFLLYSSLLDWIFSDVIFFIFFKTTGIIENYPLVNIRVG